MERMRCIAADACGNCLAIGHQVWLRSGSKHISGVTADRRLGYCSCIADSIRLEYRGPGKSAHSGLLSGLLKVGIG